MKELTITDLTYEWDTLGRVERSKEPVKDINDTIRFVDDKSVEVRLRER